MKIGIIGFGNIGATLARKLAEHGHEIKVANARGPDSIEADAAKIGVSAVTSEKAIEDIDTLILSVPLSAIPGLAKLLTTVPPEVIIVDTSNYYPFRDGAIPAIDNGLPESVWASEQLGHPVVKAWNAVLAATLINNGRPLGDPERLAIPVAGPDSPSKSKVMALVAETGFEPVDAGTLDESWRQQPGTPAYCTELTAPDLARALAGADRTRAPLHREALIQEFMAAGKDLTHDQMIARNRHATSTI